MSSIRRAVIVATGAGLLAGGHAIAGPISAYYLTAGDNGNNFVVQGGAVVLSFPQQHPGNLGEYAIAVTSTVRTLGNGNDGTNFGSQYTLGGTYTGVDYPYPVVDASFYDGASDGTFNYSVSFSDGGVYRFNADWTNPTLLFNVDAGYLGITYDSVTDTLWLSKYFDNQVENWSLSGSLLSSFAATQSALSSLALDPADNTLWMGSQRTEGTFYQYSKAGTLLDTEVYAGLAGQNTLGGEFAVSLAAVVPEPASLTLLGLATASLAGGYGVRRRKATA